MRTVIKDQSSGWRKVTSGVPQGSVLAPIMFLVYINDMMEGVGSYASLFADDAKLMRRVRVEEDCKCLQEDTDKIHIWNTEWKMQFNTSKCKILEMGRSNRRLCWDHKLRADFFLHEADGETDLGMAVQTNLSPEKHINKITRETYQLLINTSTTQMFFRSRSQKCKKHGFRKVINEESIKYKLIKKFLAHLLEKSVFS